MIDSPAILTIEHVTCRDPQHEGLNTVSLSLREQEIVCLLGAGGSGKTTLLKAVAGLIPLAEGRIALSEQIISDGQTLAPPERRQAGMIFQDAALFPHLTAAENIAFGLYGQPQEVIATAVAEMIALLKLAGLEARYPHELTGEQQQRTAIARALACKPKILLLDEPFSHIDSPARYYLIAELRLILKQLPVMTILATHDKDEAFAFADRLAVMDNGGIVQEGYPATLYQRPNSRFVADYLGSSNYLPVTILSDHQWHSLFGDHTAPHAHGQAIDSRCDWLIRPHDIALALDPDGAAEIEDRIFMGSSNHYRIRLDEQVIQVQSRIGFEPGQRVRLSIKSEQPILFPGS
ncbi:ABC transporter ATP-binding protein [Brenneria sp. g21c3]|uniref:ABC transporter ATP-binding protein n=1 Tax=Brenneria sp. g21c3 TaxID=3093893 RepID=UPI002EB9F7C9|nr:ABC transporter ATP-binding protein [Brenneria sp. g21c3]